MHCRGLSPPCFVYTFCSKYMIFLKQPSKSLLTVCEPPGAVDAAAVEEEYGVQDVVLGDEAVQQRPVAARARRGEQLDDPPRRERGGHLSRDLRTEQRSGCCRRASCEQTFARTARALHDCLPRTAVRRIYLASPTMCVIASFTPQHHGGNV